MKRAYCARESIPANSVKTAQHESFVRAVRTTVASGCPTRWIRRVYFLAAASASSSLFAPVMTILPDSKTSAVDFGSRNRIVTAEKRLGLYLRCE